MGRRVMGEVPTVSATMVDSGNRRRRRRCRLVSGSRAEGDADGWRRRCGESRGRALVGLMSPMWGVVMSPPGGDMVVRDSDDERVSAAAGRRRMMRVCRPVHRRSHAPTGGHGHERKLSVMGLCAVGFVGNCRVARKVGFVDFFF